MKTLHFDCFAGISGDMTIGALLDLGVDWEYLKTELRKLPLQGYDLKNSRVVRANISALKFDVILADGGSPEPNHQHVHPHNHGHRKASDITAMIRSSSLNANTRRIAEAIFTKLAISEGSVHRIAPEEVEFHEVGALDSIVDIVGSAIGFDALAIDRYVCSPINVGSGFVRCQHGVYPVPSPATADLLRNATIYSKHVSAELVTPTGAAILAAVVNEFTGFDGFSIERIGYGAGTKQFQDFPNCLRLLLGQEHQDAARADFPVHVDEIVVIEANIDDMTPQNLAYLTDRLLETGALDVCTIPIQMKKGRAGHLLQVLAPSNRWEDLNRTIFEEATTIGVRRHVAQRTALERAHVLVDTGYGAVSMKVSRLDGRILNVTPEYEDCARIARERHLPLKEIQAMAVRKYSEKI